MSERSQQPDQEPETNLDRYKSLLNKRTTSWTADRQFGRCLGVGGQGIVFLSLREGVDDFSIPVALKLFSPAPYDNEAAYEQEMARLARVAARVARIQQDHLIDVQNFIKRDSIHLMEMEWVDGYDLRCLLTPATFEHVHQHVTERRWQTINKLIVTDGTEQPRLKPGTAVAILRECLAAVAALHRHDIVHNDIKPSNIMLKRSGNVKIIDIGSAFELDDRPPGLPCTPAYAAPEVLQGELASPQSDLASLGYMLIEIVSGSQPFSGLSYSELIKAKKGILEQLPRILPAEEFAFSDLLIPLIRRLVNPDPAQRFPNAEAADLAEDGAAEFLRELVKGDLASDYENEIRLWIEEVETDFLVDGPNLSEPNLALPSTWSAIPEHDKKSVNQPKSEIQPPSDDSTSPRA